MKKINVNILKLIIFILPFLWGGFYEFVTFIIGTILSVNLIWLYIKNKKIYIEKNNIILITFVLVISSFLTIFWAIDTNSAIFGFLKCLCLLLFALNVTQLEEKERNDLFTVIPISSICMLSISAILAIIPATKSYVVSTSNRLTGFFQYANVCAMYILISMIIVYFSNWNNKLKIFCLSIFTISILFTGSRTVFALMILCIIVLAVHKRKESKYYIFGFLGLLGICTAFALITNNFQNIGRFLTSSIFSSTFVGRIVYIEDSLKLLSKWILGYGYLGYSYIFPKVQTAMYTTKFLHNDYLQIALDYGIISAIVFIYFIVKSICLKENNSRNKLILFLLGIHVFFEFDIEFLSIFFILLLCMSNKSTVSKKIDISLVILLLIGFVGITELYYGIASFSNFADNYEIANSMLPNYTEALECELINKIQNNDLKSAKIIADKILENNKYIVSCYEIEAMYYSSNNEVDKMIKMQEKAIELNKYDISEYENYVLFLSKQIEKSIEQERYDKADLYIEKVINIEKKLENTKNNMNKLSKYFVKQPNLELSEDIKNYIKVLNQK